MYRFNAIFLFLGGLLGIFLVVFSTRPESVFIEYLTRFLVSEGIETSGSLENANSLVLPQDQTIHELALALSLPRISLPRVKIESTLSGRRPPPEMVPEELPTAVPIPERSSPIQILNELQFVGSYTSLDAIQRFMFKHTELNTIFTLPIQETWRNYSLIRVDHTRFIFEKEGQEFYVPK